MTRAMQDENLEVPGPSDRAELPRPTESGRDLLEAVAVHVERWVGPIDAVYHEIAFDLVNVDLEWIRPRPGRPFNTLVTSGMSQLPMAVPEAGREFARAELVLNLPPDWPMTTEDWKEDTAYWPIRLLKDLARRPHEQGSWLGEGHTVPAFTDGSSYHPTTPFTGALIAPCASLPREFACLELGELRVWFWSVVPIYPEELQFSREFGADALLRRFAGCGVRDALVPGRRCCCRRNGPRA